MERDYGEIVLHPPPLCYAILILLPCLVSKFLMKYASKGFSYFMFWCENMALLFGFLAFEMAMAPVAYFKIWINIIRSSIGFLKILFNCIMFAVLGLPMLFFLIFRDVYYLIKILSYHQGCRMGVSELDEEQVNPQLELRVFNEVRATVIALYKKLQKHMRQDDNEDDSEEEEQDMWEDPDFFHIENDENMNEDFLYVVKKSLITDEWKRRCFLLEKRIRIGRLEQQDDMTLNIANIFKRKLESASNSAYGGGHNLRTSFENGSA